LEKTAERESSGGQYCGQEVNGCFHGVQLLLELQWRMSGLSFLSTVKMA